MKAYCYIHLVEGVRTIQGDVQRDSTAFLQAVFLDSSGMSSVIEPALHCMTAISNIICCIDIQNFRCSILIMIFWLEP